MFTNYDDGIDTAAVTLFYVTCNINYILEYGDQYKEKDVALSLYVLI